MYSALGVLGKKIIAEVEKSENVTYEDFSPSITRELIKLGLIEQNLVSYHKKYFITVSSSYIVYTNDYFLTEVEFTHKGIKTGEEENYKAELEIISVKYQKVNKES